MHICQRYNYLPYFLEASAPLFWADVTLNWICMVTVCSEWVLPDTGGPHTASAWALPGSVSLLPSALQLEERMKLQQLRVKRNIWTHETYISHLLCHYHFTSQPTNPCRWICNDEGQTDGEKKQKSLFLSIAIIIIIITDLAAVEAGVWSRIPGEVVLLITAGWWWSGGQLPKLPIFPSQC